ncbi:hypothetical protein JOB18_034101 [Solea senegalensis]|uniref:Secreted protein n=1 Tax=Solea senegalensis TaxID=28829 RepID=A0AAV6S2K8_SOLSE|nr:hypothetical protein JOB18_034101 [Solea senegalensis]
MVAAAAAVAAVFSSAHSIPRLHVRPVRPELQLQRTDRRRLCHTSVISALASNRAKATRKQMTFPFTAPRRGL